MSDGFPNKPKILRGAFVEFGLSLPPLLVVFQYNPLQLTRNRTLSFAVPNETPAATGASANAPQRTLRQFHADTANLLDLQKKQLVTVQEQTIGFELRLDATDQLDERDGITEQFGIAPQIATLELMVHPKVGEPARRSGRPRTGQAGRASASPAARTRPWCCSSSVANGCCRSTSRA